MLDCDSASRQVMSHKKCREEKVSWKWKGRLITVRLLINVDACVGYLQSMYPANSYSASALNSNIALRLLAKRAHDYCDAAGHGLSLH